MQITAKSFILIIIILRLISDSCSQIVENETDYFDNLMLFTKNPQGNIKPFIESLKFTQIDFINLNYENISAVCKSSMDVFAKSLENFEFWALEMYDASAKISSGILSGNIHQYGDYDQCMDVQASNGLFQGKYCLSHIMVDILEDNEHLNFLKQRILSYNPFISEFDDISHIIPKSSEIKWASCIPSTCSAKDLEISLQQALNELLQILPLNVRIQVNESDCQVKNTEKPLSIDEKLSFFFFITLFTVIVASTVSECLIQTDNAFLTAFSLRKNFSELTSIASSSNDINSMHCVRSIFTIFLLFSHKSMELNFNPITQKLQMNQFFLHPINLIFRTAYLYTDIFIMFSGFLATQSFTSRLQRGQHVNISHEIFGRYFRLMPSIVILIIFVTFILPRIGSGPLWPLLINYQSDLCKRTWMRSIFMVQNLMGFENICMMHTHHVATDFQLFLITPAIAILLNHFPQKTVTALIGIGAISTIGRFLVIYFSQMSVYVTAGVSIKSLVEVSDRMYILPVYRVTVYIMGILLAYYLQKHKCLKLSGHKKRIGWIIAALSLIITIVISTANNEPTPLRAALYSSVCSITFCGFFAWIIYTSSLGYKSILSPILEWKYWKISANLSYSIYLVQFVVFHYINGVMRGSMPYRFYGSILDFNELFIILLSATILTVCVDYPFKNLKKAIMNQKSIKNKDKTT